MNMSNNFIFNRTSDAPKELFYALVGQEDFMDDNGDPRINDPFSEKIAAKCIQNKKPKNFTNTDNHYSFFIKATPNIELYNPILLLSPIENKRQYNFIDGVCKDKWTFKEVSKITFDKYIMFLKTKNLAWLKDAQRDLK